MSSKLALLLRLRASFVLILRVIVLCIFSAAIAAQASTGTTTVLLVVGAAGDAEYGSNFLRQVELWQQACSEGQNCYKTIGLGSEAVTNDHELLHQAINEELKDKTGPFWLVFIGHGTFDGKEAWFNLRGPDVSASELASWLQGGHRPLAIINTASSSGPFLNKLSGTNRVILTATRTGNEQNFTRFGQYFAESLKDPQADVDHDGQVSLLEDFLIASRQVNEFYKVRGRLVTEHSLLDDNGDGLGTPADWFRGLRATKKPKDGAALDGLLAQQFYLIPSPGERSLTKEQIEQRDALERAVLLHREKKAQLPEDDYYRELEKLLLELAKVYAASLTTNAIPLK